MNGINKKTLLLLLTALVLLLGALMPGLTAWLHERSYQPDYAAMNSVELHLRGEASLKERLSVISNSNNTLEVSETTATRSSGEVLALAKELLVPYVDAGLIPVPDLDVEKQAYSCKPYLTVFEGEPVASVIAWQVLILFDEEEPALVLGIDDETGALVVLDFQSSKLEFTPSYFVPDETMQTLTELYLSGLGPEFSQEYPTVVDSYTKGGVRAQHWVIDWETEFGPAGISFDVWPYGVTVSLF